MLPSLGQVNIVACQSTASAIANASPHTVQSVIVPSHSTVTESVNKRDYKYSYKVKIINPQKKSESIVRQLNGFTSKFETGS